MKVWITLHTVPYEFSDTVGVYDNEEAARRHSDAITDKMGGNPEIPSGSWGEVEEHEVKTEWDGKVNDYVS